MNFSIKNGYQTNCKSNQKTVLLSLSAIILLIPENDDKMQKCSSG